MDIQAKEPRSGWVAASSAEQKSAEAIVVIGARRGNTEGKRRKTAAGDTHSTLIRRYLQSGILLGGGVQLSSILLNELDRELTKRGHRFVRYADDCSIFLRSKRAAGRVKASITRFLEGKLLLEVNQTKTKICRPVHFVLLGHAFTSTYKKGERGKYRLSIARNIHLPPCRWKNASYSGDTSPSRTTTTKSVKRSLFHEPPYTRPVRTVV